MLDNRKQISRGTKESIVCCGSALKMEQKRFLVLVIKYEEENEKNIKNLLEKMTASIDSKNGETKLIYEGYDERIVAVLESVLKLTE
jgi:hypothetical protein